MKTRVLIIIGITFILFSIVLVFMNWQIQNYCTNTSRDIGFGYPRWLEPYHDFIIVYSVYFLDYKCVQTENDFDRGYVDPEPEINNMECEPSRYEIIRNCLAIYNCSIDKDHTLNEKCIESHQGVSVREMCFNPDSVIIQKSTGCMLLPQVGTTNCNVDFACPDVT